MKFKLYASIVFLALALFSFIWCWVKGILIGAVGNFWFFLFWSRFLIEAIRQMRAAKQDKNKIHHC